MPGDRRRPVHRPRSLDQLLAYSSEGLSALAVPYALERHAERQHAAQAAILLDDQRPRARSRGGDAGNGACRRSEEHTSELQSLMRISYAVFCLKKNKTQ